MHFLILSFITPKTSGYSIKTDLKLVIVVVIKKHCACQTWFYSKLFERSFYFNWFCCQVCWFGMDYFKLPTHTHTFILCHTYREALSLSMKAAYAIHSHMSICLNQSVRLSLVVFVIVFVFVYVFIFSVFLLFFSTELSIFISRWLGRTYC